MRCVVIGDTHGYHDLLGELPKGDVLIHVGDFLNDSSNKKCKRSFYSFDDWLSEQDFAIKLVIAGNHDRLLDPGEKPIKLQNATYLQDQYFIYEGVTFYGSPWTPSYHGVFNASETQLFDKYNNISNSVDVLITHGPPRGILDKTSTNKHIGSKALLGALNKIKPKVHVFGHVHFSYGEHYEEGYYNDGKIEYYNASMAGKNNSMGDKDPIVFVI
jgi:Icc-related predicted phosphoesterase